MSVDPENNVPLPSEYADDADMAELIELFVAEMPLRVEALCEAFSESSLEALQRLAHQLKGAAPGYGYPSIGAAAADLECATQRGSELDELRLQLDELINLCNRAGMSG